MTISREQFECFWSAKGQYLRIYNKERLKDNLIKKIEENIDLIKLDDYVCGLRTGKESTRQFVVYFYDYLKKQGMCIESNLFEKKFYDYPFERQLEIAKYLHEPRSIDEIKDKFGINVRTARQDLSALEEGITVLSSTIKIKKEKKGRSYFYRTTLHPVFLPLNLTEVYAMTVYLNQAVGSSDPNAQMIQDISERIKAQLSDYAYNKLFPESTRKKSDNNYINDENFAKQRKNIYMYLMKSGQRCKFFWKGEEHYGRIRKCDGEHRICLEDGAVLDAEIGDVNFIVEELDYK